jgi:hypothetical protein
LVALSVAFLRGQRMIRALGDANAEKQEGKGEGASLVRHPEPSFSHKSA